MSRFRCLTLGFTLWAVVAAATPVSADPVQITSGFLLVSGAPEFDSRGWLRSIGYEFVTDEFTVTWFEGDGITQNVLAPRLPRPTNYTAPGETASRIAFINDYPVMSITAVPATTQTPFQLSGNIEIVDWDGRRLFQGLIVGAGMATWKYSLTPGGAPVVSQVRYDFSDAAPTPEPATLLLLGGGLVALAARRRRKG